MAGTSTRRAGPRATKAFLFTDLRDYTRFVETHGDLAAAALLRAYRSIVRREVVRRSGAEIKTEGDSFYVVFDSPKEALDCAVAILRRATTDASAHADRPLHVGIGLHAGETVAYDRQFVGSAVIIASRLSSAARAGELLVSDTFRGMVRTGQSYTLVDRGNLLLKGLSEPIRVWSVEWDVTPLRGPAPVLLPAGDVPRPATAGQLVCPVVVGREAEFARATGLVDAVFAGQGNTMLVAGEAGIGKTAFAREMTGRARERGFRVLSGGAVEYEAGLPYSPITSSIRASFPEQDLPALLHRAAPDLVPLFPELGRAAAPTAFDSPVERHRIAIAFRAFLAGFAKHAPLFVLLEDLHWADEATLALIHRLARELRTFPVLVCGTYRSDELRRRHPLLPLLAHLRRERLVTEIGLDRLDATGTGELIRRTLASDGDGIGEALRDEVFARSEGNPFFTEELLRSLAESGAIYRDPGGWAHRPLDEIEIPASIRDAVEARLALLSPRTAQALATASVLGTSFELPVLCRMRGCEEADLEPDLRESIDQQLLAERNEERVPTYAFRHALTREVVYDRLLAPERRRLHVAAANALATTAAAPALLAHHWKLGGDAGRAAEAFEAAGAAALCVYAFAEAARHYEEAIAARGTPIVEHYLGLARAYLAGDLTKAREAAERGLELLAAGPADIERRIELMRIAGRARWLAGDAEGNFELARSAVQLVEDGADLRSQARAYDWHANALMTRGRHGEARTWAERALELARQVDDGATEASALITLAGGLPVQEPARALALLDEAASIARRAGSAFVLARAHQNGIVASYAVEPERRRYVRIERALEFGERYGYSRAQFAAFSAFHRFLAADWPADGRFATTGDVASDLSVAWVHVLEILVAAARGGPTAELLETARALVRRAVRTEESQWAVPWLTYEAILLSWAERLGDATGRAAEAKAFAARTDAAEVRLTTFCRGYSSVAVPALLIGDRAGLSAMRDALERMEGSAGEREALGSFIARLDGDEAAAIGSLETAEGALAERGLHFAFATDVWALARQGALGSRWRPLVDRAASVLDRAQATWLRDDLLRRLGSS